MNAAYNAASDHQFLLTSNHVYLAGGVVKA